MVRCVPSLNSFPLLLLVFSVRKKCLLLCINFLPLLASCICLLSCIFSFFSFFKVDANGSPGTKHNSQLLLLPVCDTAWQHTVNVCVNQNIQFTESFVRRKRKSCWGVKWNWKITWFCCNRTAVSSRKEKREDRVSFVEPLEAQVAFFSDVKSVFVSSTFCDCIPDSFFKESQTCYSINVREVLLHRWNILSTRYSLSSHFMTRKNSPLQKFRNTFVILVLEKSWNPPPSTPSLHFEPDEYQQENNRDQLVLLSFLCTLCWTAFDSFTATDLSTHRPFTKDQHLRVRSDGEWEEKPAADALIQTHRHRVHMHKTGFVCWSNDCWRCIQWKCWGTRISRKSPCNLQTYKTTGCQQWFSSSSHPLFLFSLQIHNSLSPYSCTHCEFVRAFIPLPFSPSIGREEYTHPYILLPIIVVIIGADKRSRQFCSCCLEKRWSETEAEVHFEGKERENFLLPFLLWLKGRRERSHTSIATREQREDKCMHVCFVSSDVLSHTITQ